MILNNWKTASLFTGIAAFLWLIAEVSAEGQKTDWSLFPKSYGVLSNERLMHPVDVSHWPLKIDRKRQLFVDDYLVAFRTGLTREVHQPWKHPNNPLILPEKPWEGVHIHLGQVIYDEESSRFRMWYTGGSRYIDSRGIKVRFPCLYAESMDGVHWDKPELGLFEYNGSRQNNIVMPMGGMAGLFLDPDNPDPNQRYRALFWHEPEYEAVEGYYLYHSPDGIKWTRSLPECIVRNAPKWQTNPRDLMAGIGDTSIFRYDPLLEKYVCDAKLYANELRFRGMMESDDLIHWSRPKVTIYPDSLDEPDSQIYANLSFDYESMWLGFLRVMHTERTGWKQVEVELSASRDGRTWSRVGQREIFIPLGRPESWEPDYTDPSDNGPLLIGDELWFYYRGTRMKERDHTEEYHMSLGLAKLRRDGFVSLDAGKEPGSLITRPINFPQGRLHLNIEIAKGGSARVAILTREGESIDSYAIEDCIPIKEDSTSVEVVWKNRKSISCPTDKHLRFKFVLEKAKLYSFWID